MVKEKPRFLLITNSEGDPWRIHLEKTLAHLACLDVVERNSAIPQVLDTDYLAIIVDAASIGDFSLLVSRIRAQVPHAKVIIVTESPTWQLAREAFEAGATDYFERSLNTSDLLTSVTAALAKPVGRWPR